MSFDFRRLALFGLALLAANAGSITARAAEGRLVNLSSRGVVGTGADVMIAGFVIGGTAPKDVLVRAVGPALTASGVKGSLEHARLQVFDIKGNVIAENQGWSDSLANAFLQVGASPLPAGSRDAALRITLSPGNYSVIVSGVTQPVGIALVEVYEMGNSSRLLNLSTRARVQPGEGVLISGLVISGGEKRRVLLRASGPALIQSGVADVLTNPVLSLFKSATKIATNDDWGSDGMAAQITAASKTVGAAPFASGSKDSAMLVDLAPGIYSMQVSGGAGVSGITLLEVFDVPLTSGSGSLPIIDTPVEVVDPIPATPPIVVEPIAGTYSADSLSWTKSALSTRLGPTFAQLNPGAVDDRPTHFTNPTRIAEAPYYIRINQYELGELGGYNNYWSDSGQVGYVPDDPVNDPGLDRIQTYAYYNKVFSIGPRLDYASGKPHPDPQTLEKSYIEMNGGPLKQPVAMVRSYGMQQNEQVMVYRDGLFAVAGMQTSRSGSERPYPGFKFPKHKVPRAIAITTSNEFALVTIWDTNRHQGQLAIVALEAKFLSYHTFPYMGFPNQGSFSDFKLLGYIDLPMASPNAVAAASNGLWTGPSATDNRVLSQIDLSDEKKRGLLYDGAWQSVVAKSGYAIVTSTEENKAVVVDLTPLFAYMRESYLSSATSFAQTVSSRGAAPHQFPQTFDVNPAIMPKVIWQTAVTQPTAVLAGNKVGRWSKDRFKGYIATRDGTIRILDTSSLMARNSWEVRGELKEIGTVKVGRNPVSMALARHGEGKLPLLPVDSDGAQPSRDSFNNVFYVACRGDRSVEAVVTWHGKGEVFRRIQDTRMDDPVAVSVAIRGNIVTVADFNGKKLLNFRIGTLRDSLNDKTYLPGDPAYSFEFGGELPLLGSPFLVNSANVN